MFWAMPLSSRPSCLERVLLALFKGIINKKEKKRQQKHGNMHACNDRDLVSIVYWWLIVFEKYDSVLRSG
jgi:hypothetical protein